MAGPLVMVCGAINWDITLFIPNLPAPGEEVRAKKVIRVPGGTGANVAVAASRLLGKGKVALLGALGRDALAQEQLRELGREGVITDCIKIIENEESGQAYILVDERGQNVICTHFGANSSLRPDHVREGGAAEMVSGAKVCVVMDPPLDTAEELLALSKEKGLTTIWDPGVHSERGLGGLRGVSSCDYLVANDVEAMRLFGGLSREEIFEGLAEIGGAKLVVKMGPEGSRLFDASAGRVLSVPAFPLERFGMRAISTVGSGDAFLGAFASFKALGLDDEECLMRANCAGAFKATRAETRGSPTRQELERMFSAAKDLIKPQVQ